MATGDFTYERLTEITTIANAAGAVYTHDTATYSKTYVRLIIIHNGNTSAEEVKLYNVPDNVGAVGTAGATNIMYDPDAKIAVGETVTLEFPAPGVILEDDNDTIQAVTDTASKVTIQIYGGAVAA